MAAADHAPSFYAATANSRPAHPRLAGDATADVCVVGAGFTGISAALHLAERGYDVAVLEAARLAWGASGRNGGQVCTGQRQDVFTLEKTAGSEAAKALWDMAEESKAFVAERIARHEIDCDYRPGQVLAATKAGHIGELAEEAAHLERHYGYDKYRMIAGDEIAGYVDSPTYVGGRYDAGAGHLHPLNYALGLAAAAEAAGARFFEDSRVTGIDWTRRPVVRTAGGSVTADHVLLCTNAYLDDLEPRIAPVIMPIGNYMLATAPLGENRARALIGGSHCVCGTNFVVDHYRMSADHRLIYGGGETYTRRQPTDLKAWTRRHMLDVFPQLDDAAIDYAWGGDIAVTLVRMPHFGRLGAAGFFAHGFCGQGVTIGPLAGKLLAEAVAGTAERFDVFARLPQRAFPGGTMLRRPAQVLGMLYYAMRDRVG